MTSFILDFLILDDLDCLKDCRSRSYYRVQSLLAPWHWKLIGRHLQMVASHFVEELVTSDGVIDLGNNQLKNYHLRRWSSDSWFL
jgi:hypothetical protein